MIAAALAFAVVAASAPPARLVYCHMGECAWSREASNEIVRTTPTGTLRKYFAFNGTSTFRDNPPSGWSPRIRIQWPARPSADYVFCSRSQPALAFHSDGGWIAHALDLFDLYGYDTASAVIYLRACHGLDLNSRDIDKRLKALGYRPGTRSDQVEIKSPNQLVALPRPHG
jgi:hypothetical protein